MTNSYLHMRSRALRFAATGVLVSALHVAVAAILLSILSLSSAAANGIAFGVATTVSFIINTAWSFASRLEAGRLARFGAVSLIGCAVAVMVASAAETRGFTPWVGIGFVVLTVPPLTFILHNVWTYR